MTTQTPNPLPPTTLHTTTPISQSAAHDFLAAYLDRANTDPALQPNAAISEHGPVSRTTASAPNLILHNLKRVQAGLAGETLGRDLTIVKMDMEGDAGAAAGANAAGAGVDTDAAGAEGQGQGQGQVTQAFEGQMEVDAEEDAGGIDKEERKRKKKERRLAEKKAKANAEA